MRDSRRCPCPPAPSEEPEEGLRPKNDEGDDREGAVDAVPELPRLPPLAGPGEAFGGLFLSPADLLAATTPSGSTDGEPPLARSGLFMMLDCCYYFSV